MTHTARGNEQSVTRARRGQSALRWARTRATALSMYLSVSGAMRNSCRRRSSCMHSSTTSIVYSECRAERAGMTVKAYGKRHYGYQGTPDMSGRRPAAVPSPSHVHRTSKQVQTCNAETILSDDTISMCEVHSWAADSWSEGTWWPRRGSVG